MLPATLSDFVTFLGTPAFIAFLAAHVLVHVPAYMALSALAKQVVGIVLSAVFGIISLVIVNFVNPALLVQFQPVYAIIAALIMAWLGGQTTLAVLMVNRAFDSKKVF